MNESILLSVIVPTYNRYQYLRGCIKSVLRVKSDEFEMIIEDNTVENGEIVRFIETIDDKRLKYFHTVEHVSQMENSDLAMSHAQGEYIVMLGDDDSICENIIDAVRFLKENKIDAANYLIPGFNWPDMTFEGKKKEANFFLDEKANGTVVIENEKEELFKAVRLAAGLRDRMPRAYHGIVSKRVMDCIYKKTGSYFPGPSPDMGNAAAVCVAAKRSVFIYDYLIVSGYGYNSARGEGNRQNHYGDIKEKPWLPKDILERWDKEIPEIFSAETIIATSLTESLKRMGQNKLVKQYNYGVLYALFLRYHKDAAGALMKFCLKKPVRLVKLCAGIVERLAERHRLIKQNKGRTNYYENEDVTTLEEAQDIIKKIREDIGIKELKLIGS